MDVKTPIISAGFLIQAPKIMFQIFDYIKFNHSPIDPMDYEF